MNLSTFGFQDKMQSVLSVSETSSDESSSDAYDDTEAKRIDLLCKERFNFISNIVEELVKEIKSDPEGILEMCKSETNSKPIADYMEQLTSLKYHEILIKNKINYKIYKNTTTHYGRSDHDMIINNTSVDHIDNKGVRVRKIKENFKINDLKDKFKELDLNPPTQDRWISYIKFIKENKLLDEGKITGEIYKDNNVEKIRYISDYYIEDVRYREDEDGNFHMKSSQSNLFGFEGRCTVGGEKNTKVIYNGKIPIDTIIPHFTFIIKHVYSYDHGIQKLVLYSVPHGSLQKRHYPCIQKKIDKTRGVKADTEFRFNMNDCNGNPYKFLNSEETRYKIFNIIDIDYK
jgi:hypothetical protein